jgi:hypothetical protein
MLPAPLKFLNLLSMNERGEKLIGQKAKDDAMINFVSRQAQEAILNPDLPEGYKDEMLSIALRTIHKISERRKVYFAKHGEERRTRKRK